MASLPQVFAAAVMQLIPLVLSLTVHEYAHAAVAKRLGDDTAERAGRLTLNPAAHVDPIGTLLLPLGLLLLAGSTGGMNLPFFGWAKPTPVNVGRMTRALRARTLGMLVAGAGPLSNLLLAAACAVGVGVGAQYGLGSTVGMGLITLALQMTFLNVGLAVFNLLPLSVLDGHDVVVGLLPGRAAHAYTSFNARYGTTLLWGVVIFGRGFLATPIRAIAGGLLRVVGAG